MMGKPKPSYALGKLWNHNVSENNDLSNELKKKEDNISTLQDKIKLMNISKSVEVSKEEVKASRLKINEYVREIDKCIALLNK